MRYAIDFDRAVNRLIPFYLGGKKFCLFVQSIVHPLQQVNELFVSYAKETRIETCMTSQIFYFEWYLNRKFKKYFANSAEKITITNGRVVGTPIYFENADVSDEEHVKIGYESEDDHKLTLYRSNESTPTSQYDFTVTTPQINTNKITMSSYVGMLESCIEKYRIGNKTYTIYYYGQ